MADRRLSRVLSLAQGNDQSLGDGVATTGAAMVLADALRDALVTNAFAAPNDGGPDAAAKDVLVLADAATADDGQNHPIADTTGSGTTSEPSVPFVDTGSIAPDTSSLTEPDPGDAAREHARLASDPAPSGDVGTDGAYVAPVAAVENEIVDQFHSAIEAASHNLGDPADTAVHSLTSMGENMGMGFWGQPGWDGGANPLTAALNIPDETINGDGLAPAVGNFFLETPDALAFTGSFLSENVDNADLANPGGLGLVDSIMHAVGSGNLVSADGADVGGNGDSLLGDAVASGNSGGGSLLGDLIDFGDGDGGSGHSFITADANANRDQSGAIIDGGIGSNQHGDPTSAEHASHLIDVGALPMSGNDAGNVNVLASPGEGQQQSADLHAIDNTGDGPRLVDADVLTNDEYAVPAADGSTVPTTASVPTLNDLVGTGNGMDLPLLSGGNLDLPVLSGNGLDSTALSGDLLGNTLGTNGLTAPGLIPQVVTALQDHDFALI